LGSKITAHLIEAERLILEAPRLTCSGCRHVARHKVVAALDLDAVAGEEHRHLVARGELVQELLPGLVEGAPAYVLNFDDIKAHRFQGGFHCPSVPDATATKVGVSCVVYPWLGCGECPTCKRGEENLCAVKARAMGVFMPGGYAEYVLVPHERYCVDLGKLDPVESAPLACSGVTTYSALNKFGSKIKEEPVVIMGAGGLGHMALSVLRAMGGKGAVVVDIDAEKRKAAMDAGALAAVDGAASDASQQIIKATDGGAASVLDLVGASATVSLGIASIKKGGEIVVVGLYGGELKLPIVYLPLRGMGLRGSYVGSLPELKELVALAQKGTLKPIKVTRRKLPEASAALSDLKAGKVVGRIVLVPQTSPHRLAAGLSRTGARVLFRKRIGTAVVGPQGKSLHAHGNEAVVAEYGHDIENAALAEHGFDASVGVIGHIARIQELQRKLVGRSLIGIRELGRQTLAQGFERVGVHA
jgi:D-arabinose 1-dehydrogenase-like Zn-dependent alcohol dehydrogenase